MLKNHNINTTRKSQANYMSIHSLHYIQWPSQWPVAMFIFRFQPCIPILFLCIVFYRHEFRRCVVFLSYHPKR